MNIKPLADRVLIEPKEAETKTASGIYIPDTAKEKPQAGKVVAAGSGKKDDWWKITKWKQDGQTRERICLLLIAIRHKRV